VYVSFGARNPECETLAITTSRGLAVVLGSSFRTTQSLQVPTRPALGPWFFTVQVTRTVAGSAISRALSTETPVTTRSGNDGRVTWNGVVLTNRFDPAEASSTVSAVSVWAIR